jgi:glycosyltransferase involved in cell wall biosynthesis
MAYLFDLASIKEGGGLQLAANFLAALQDSAPRKNGTELTQYVLVSRAMEGRCDKSLRVAGVVPSSLVTRAYYEYVAVPRIIEKHGITTVYTFFGAGLPRLSGARSVVSVAYPIICYPESPYWKYVPLLERLKKRLWNFVRISRLRRASVIISETETMRARLSAALGGRAGIIVSPPAVTEFLEDVPVQAGSSPASEAFELLVLSGLAYHKNIWRLYDVAKLLCERGVRVRFVCSFRRENFLAHVLKMNKAGAISPAIVDEYFDFIGPVRPEGIAALYDRCQALLNVSDLESFSNNYMEAWKTATLLICSDRDFARAICREGAIYCEPHDCESVASAIERAFRMDPDARCSMLKAGKTYLAELPTQREKARAILAAMESAP